MSHAQEDVPDRVALARFLEERSRPEPAAPPPEPEIKRLRRTSRESSTHLYIVALGSLGLPVDVITCGNDGAWRTIEGARRMKIQLEDQMPHGPRTTYHIVNGHRA